MVFSSALFLFLFLPIVLIFYYNPIIKKRGYRNAILLISSLIFYAWGEPVFVLLMITSIIINFAIGLAIDKNDSYAKRKVWLITAIIFDVLVIFIFKYLGFTVNNICTLAGIDNVKVNIALPIGISFFTFQIMSYIFDVYYKKAKAQKNVFDLALYISMFPQLVAGPIVRYETIADEIGNRVELPAQFTAGMIRFIYGLGKKVLISNYVAQIADNIFVLESVSVSSAWLGAIAYSLQIFFDFSGYSDMAIGLGLVFGFHFNENFNYPYIAKSITDFWRRWHISLSTWFRDYVYIPLGGNRVSKPRWVFNMFVVWLLTGIWHGANWTFIAWGLFYFVLLATEKLLNTNKNYGKLKVLPHISTLLFVIIGWVLFRSESISDAIRYIGNMFGIGATSFVDDLFMYYLDNGKLILIVSLILSTPVMRVISSKMKVASENKIGLAVVYDAVKSVVALAIFVLSVLCCVSSSYNPFIYFNF
ncbi:MAG: MBOAT family protein [Ruminococcaceae bacterium]|nr:MBOAT family protein [Oscillospiraceae bacterium]